MFCFFLFQAEVGIRDPLCSRALGDVYNRQVRLQLILKLPLKPRDHGPGFSQFVQPVHLLIYDPAFDSIVAEHLFQFL